MKEAPRISVLRREALKENLTAATPVAAAQLLKEARPTTIFLILACLVPLFYALYTNHIWEDFFITFRHSQNLVEGKGLVYNPGERIHGFTSPIGVLLPAFCYFITGQSSYLPALWLFRIISIVAFAASSLLLLKSLLNAPGNHIAATWFLAAVYLFDAKAVAYSTNGMETAFMLLFLSWGVYLLAKGEVGNWLARGVCWAGLMWTRPDGCVYIAALALAEVVFYGGAKKQAFTSLLKSGAITAVLYLPWFVWAWTYYGSPVPHTVIAKSNVEFGAKAQLVATLETLVDRFPGTTARVFQPIYYWPGGGWFPYTGWILPKLTTCLGLFSGVYWAVPVNDRLGRIASFCFALVCLYLCSLLSFFNWYFPPASMLGFLVLARGIPVLANAMHKRFSRDEIYSQAHRVAVPILFTIALVQLSIFAVTTLQMKIQQEEVEMGNRARIGEWLRTNGRPTDTVYLEPLGYIGYFSGLRMIDFPGLVSPQVVRLRRDKGLNKATLTTEILPDWVVLRPMEYEAVRNSTAFQVFRENYSIAKVFDVRPSLERYAFIPGKYYLDFDAVFTVFKRNVPQDKRALKKGT
jgi:hypothetical protein